MNVASIPNVLRKNSNTSQTNVFTSVCFHSERHLFFVGKFFHMYKNQTYVFKSSEIKTFYIN